MDSRVVIVGAGGFLGQALVSALLAAGRHVTAIHREHSLRLDPDGSTSSAQPRSPGDIGQLLEGASAVAWMAGATTPGTSAGRPMREIEENLTPLLQALDSLRGDQVPLMFVSSGGTVYGADGGRAASLDRPLFPASYYGAGKAAAEHFIGAWSQQTGSSALILRPSNIYGPGQPNKPAFGIVPAAMNALLQNRELVLWGDGSAVRDYLYLSDFTRLACSALLSGFPAGVTRLHASSGTGVSVLELLSLLERIGGRTIRRTHAPARTVDVPRIVLDNSDALDRFGWSPRVGLEAGLRETWEWFRSTQP